ncbi:NAD(P)H-dependent flavin oxidoreductase [Agrobacterium tumefaciens]|uniref:NAD(P)H-dependent flavin oxidoreductase n=1 Tax=Agrobacterium tumefaciens TaxID=358 RepID=UPI003BB8738F
MEWKDRRIIDLFGIDLPVIQAPMAGASTPEMAVEVSNAGGLGSIPSAQYSAEQLRDILSQVRRQTSKPINVNFFSHVMPQADPARDMRWRGRLAPYYVELGLDPSAPLPTTGRKPFDTAFCEVVEELRPAVVSFHFGLPPSELVERVRNTGAKIISSATTVSEALWLEERGVDAVIAMGFEAGGHRGNFLSSDMSTQVGTMALVPQIVDAVKVPVIAAGGIGDGRGVAAALILGASAVQIGTAYLFSPEAKIPAVHRKALETASDDNTALTNVFTGRPARGVVNRIMREVGPLSELAPAFPTAGSALAPLRSAAEEMGSDAFTNLWSGQAAKLSPHMPAADLTRNLAEESAVLLGCL